MTIVAEQGQNKIQMETKTVPILEGIKKFEQNIITSKSHRVSIVYWSIAVRMFNWGRTSTTGPQRKADEEAQGTSDITFIKLPLQTP